MRFFLAVIIILTGCTSGSSDAELHAVIEEYYHNYQKRQDFDAFMAHYADDVKFQDIINGDQISGIAAVKEFFQWDNPEFKLLDTVAFIIEDQIIDEKMVCTKGYFTPFEWAGTTYESMYFTSILHFDNNNKIIKHTDWINYPNALVDYNERKNANVWIGTSY